MCGRFGVTMSTLEASRRLGLSRHHYRESEPKPKYNACPGVPQLIAAAQPDDLTNPVMTQAHWGFISSWQTDKTKAVINMRLESADKKYWHRAFSKRRCVIPANWWYEWRPTPAGKQPYAIQPCDITGFFLAGVWSLARNLAPDEPQQNSQTFAIVTQPASADIAAIHPRMPVALSDEGARKWLQTGWQVHELTELIQQNHYRAYASWPVHPRVGSTAHDDQALIDLWAPDSKTDMSGPTAKDSIS